jgi:Resolvase, N terminal domain
MTIIGCARVSTTDQDLEIQIAALKREGCGTIRSEKRSGTTTEGREELRTVLDFLIFDWQSVTAGARDDAVFSISNRSTGSRNRACCCARNKCPSHMGGSSRIAAARTREPGGARLDRSDRSDPAVRKPVSQAR